MITFYNYLTANNNKKAWELFSYFLLLGPFLALAGNAVPDIWLVLAIVFFLLLNINNKSRLVTLPLWFKVALIFWLWLIFCALVSEWPIRALIEIIPWIRFPVFAVLLAVCFGQIEDEHRLKLIYAMMAALSIMIIMLGIERASNFNQIRLYGFWNSPFPSWYIFGFGVPIIAHMMYIIYSQNKLWPFSIVGLIVLFAFNTGEVYMSLAIVLSILLFVVFAGFKLTNFIIIGFIIGCSYFMLAVFDQQLLLRFTSKLIVRLPWLSTSDYYDAWIGGINTGLQNPLFGVGPDNFDMYCNKLYQAGDLASLGAGSCPLHPHQLYIQTFSEGGLIGLFLFITLVSAILFHVGTIFYQWRRQGGDQRMARAMAMLITALWPVSTYAEAFGQHRNFFTWFVIGFGLAITSSCSKMLKSGNVKVKKDDNQ